MQELQVPSNVEAYRQRQDERGKGMIDPGVQ